MKGNDPRKEYKMKDLYKIAHRLVRLHRTETIGYYDHDHFWFIKTRMKFPVKRSRKLKALKSAILAVQNSGRRDQLEVRIRVTKKDLEQMKGI
jgi:hypothetical protein